MHLELLFTPQHVPAKIKKQLAGFRQRERPRRTVEQRNTQLALQLLDLLARRGLADPISSGAPADALPLRYIFENFGTIEHHTLILVIRMSNVNPARSFYCLIIHKLVYLFKLPV